MDVLAQFGPNLWRPKLAHCYDVIHDNMPLPLLKKDFWGDNRALLATICTASCVIGLTMTRFYKFNQKVTSPPSDQRMKALGIKSYEGIDAICLMDDVPFPKIEKSNEVLIKVKASAIDPSDFKIITGKYNDARQFFSRSKQAWDGEFPLILGRDCAGIVADVGEDVSEFKRGDEVWAISPACHQGYMSEYIAIPKEYVDHKPRNLTFIEAAAIPYSGAIAYHALIRQAQLGPTFTKAKRVLIHDGSSEVGLLAIQLVKVWGGHVTTTVKKGAIAKAIKMGVNDIIVHDIDDFAKELQKRKKFDVILNTMGTILHEQSKELCNTDGIILSLVSNQSTHQENGTIQGKLQLILSHLKNVFTQRIIKGNDIWWSNTEMTAASLCEIRDLIESQKLSPTVDSIWDLSDFAKAYQHAAKSPTCGKVVIRIEEAI